MPLFSKKIISVIVLMMLVGGLLALPVLAKPEIGFGTKGLTSAIAERGGYDKGGNELTLSQSIGQVIKVVLSLVGTIFFVLTIYAGFLWMTASGNEEQVTKATDILKAAAIGIVITMAAYGITAFVVIYTNKSSTAGGVGGASDGCCVITNIAGRSITCQANTQKNSCEAYNGADRTASWVVGACPSSCN